MHTTDVTVEVVIPVTDKHWKNQEIGMTGMLVF